MMAVWQVTRFLMKLELQLISFAWVFLDGNWVLNIHTHMTSQVKEEGQKKQDKDTKGIIVIFKFLMTISIIPRRKPR